MVTRLNLAPVCEGFRPAQGLVSVFTPEDLSESHFAAHHGLPIHIQLLLGGFWRSSKQVGPENRFMQAPGLDKK
jgi:hypothetical protein